MNALVEREAKYNEEQKLFGCLVDLLSYEKITFNGECLKIVFNNTVLGNHWIIIEIENLTKKIFRV